RRACRRRRAGGRRPVAVASGGRAVRPVLRLRQRAARHFLARRAAQRPAPVGRGARRPRRDGGARGARRREPADRARRAPDARAGSPPRSEVENRSAAAFVPDPRGGRDPPLGGGSIVKHILRRLGAALALSVATVAIVAAAASSAGGDYT